MELNECEFLMTCNPEYLQDIQANGHTVQRNSL